jgi:hypothetical protein
MSKDARFLNQIETNIFQIHLIKFDFLHILVRLCQCSLEMNQCKNTAYTSTITQHIRYLL